MASKQHTVAWLLKVDTKGGPEIAALRSELDKLGKIKSFGDLKKKTEEAEKAWQSATTKVAELARALESTSAPTKTQINAFERAKIQAAALKNQYEGNRLALHKLRGELSQSGVNTSNLAAAQRMASARSEELRSAIDRAKAMQKTYNAELGNAKTASLKALQGFNTLRDGVTSLQGSVAGLMRFAPAGIAGLITGAGAKQAVSKVFDVAKMAAEYETLGVSMAVIGRNAGYTRAELREVEKALQAQGIAMRESRAIIANLAAAGIDLSHAVDLSVIAQDAATVAQINSSEAYDRMVDGITSGNVQILKTLGLNVKFEQGYRALAKQLGKNRSELTPLEEMQARVNVVMEAGVGIAGTYAAAMETAGKAATSLARYEGNLSTKLGEFFKPAYKVWVDEYTKILKVLEDRIDKTLERLRKGEDDPADERIRIPFFAITDSAINLALDRYKKWLGKRLREEEAAAKEIEAREAASAEVRKAINAQLTEFKSQNLESVLEKTKETLKEAEAAEKKYAEQVKRYQEQREQARLSTEEKVRSLLRTTMSEYNAYRDKQLEAQETLERSRAALAAGDADAAESWAKKAQEQFASLNAEVKAGERVIVSAAQANRIAVDGVREAGKALDEAHQARIQKAQADQKKEQARIQQATEDIKTLEEAMSQITDLEIQASVQDQATEVLHKIQRELEKIKDKTVTVTVRYKPEGSSEEGKAAGGRIPGYATGGRLPGFSRRDNMRGLIRGRTPIGLAGGEFITNAMATRTISQLAPGLLENLNKVRTEVDLSRILSAAQGLPAGGRVSGSYRFTFAHGGQEASVTTSSKTEADSLLQLAAALQRKKLISGV